MSYNWTPASTPQGRERLNELVLTGQRIPVMVNIPIYGKFIAYARVWDNNIDRFSIVARHWEQGYVTSNTRPLEGIQFLDPSPQQPDGNGLLQTILNLPDDTSAAYIKGMIHDQLKRE